MTTMSNISLEDVLNKWAPLFERKQKRVYGTTNTGQEYAITVSKAIDGLGWCKIGLYLKEDHMRMKQLTPYYVERIFSNKDVHDRIQSLKNCLNNVSLFTYKFLERLDTDARDYFKIVYFPDDCKTTPEQHLRRGDHVRISRNGGLYTHDAIYIGENKVIHLFGNDRQSSFVREDRWSTFIGNSTSSRDVVSVLVYRLRTKSPDEIVATAESFLGIRHLHGQYHLIKKNCQHFASYCAVGKEISYGVLSAEDYLIEKFFDPLRLVGKWIPRPSTVLQNN